MGAIRGAWEFQLSAGRGSPSIGVGVRLEHIGERWVATAAHERRSEIGLGATARAALTAAVRSLAPASAAALLADPALFDVSWRLLQAG
jgi:hypothetical protein